MFKVFTTLAVAAGLAGAIVPAQAEPSTDAEFLRQLANHGFDAATGSQGLITAGHIVCNSIDANRGSTPDTLQSAIAAAACRNGCWEEPRCHTYAPFEVPNDWPPERQLAVAVNRHIREPFPGGLELE